MFAALNYNQEHTKIISQKITRIQINMALLRCWTLLTLIMMVHSAKILIVIPFSGKSHYHSTRVVGLELAKRGHEVHVITTHLEKEHPANYHQIEVENRSFWDLSDGLPLTIFDMRKLCFAQSQQMMYDVGIKHTELTLKSPAVRKFMEEDHNFDLVLSEVFFQEALYMFAYRYNAPLVLMTTFGNSLKTNFFTRNPPQLSTIVHEYGKIVEPESFIGRLKNIFYCVYDMILLKTYFLPKQQELVDKYFKDLPPIVPSLEEIAANASLVLLNSHFSVDGAAAYLPNTIEVGGLQLRQTNKKLPEDLQNFLDSSPEGIILVSFGSNLNSSELDLSKREAFLNVFSRLKHKVLLKWEEDSLPGKPNNVEIRKWLPQQELLAHSNIKLLITHGGLIGLQEAIFYGVPVLGVPIFGDQFNNLLQSKRDGYAEILEYDDITEDKLETLLSKMINNDSYHRKAKEVSERYKDRPMSGLESAIYWIEYVIRNNGASFMKSPGLKMNILAFYLVDVELFLLAILIIALILPFIIVKTLSNKLKRAPNSHEKKKN